MIATHYLAYQKKKKNRMEMGLLFERKYSKWHFFQFCVSTSAKMCEICAPQHIGPSALPIFTPLWDGWSVHHCGPDGSHPVTVYCHGFFVNPTDFGDPLTLLSSGQHLNLSNTLFYSMTNDLLNE